jgi:hypothetical protein
VQAEAIARIALDVLSRQGQKRPPVDIDYVASGEGLVYVLTDVERISGGYFCDLDGHGHAIISSREHPLRQRFTKAHELGHHLLASCEIRIDSSSGKSSGSLFAICWGLHAVAQRRSVRRPCRRPIHRTFGPVTTAPAGLVITPARRSCTYCRSVSFVASLASFGRLARRSACHWAFVARYSSPPPRVAALRRSSREIVEGERPIRRAISRTPHSLALRMAISSRWTKDK